jgi:hypothetical protein
VSASGKRAKAGRSCVATLTLAVTISYSRRTPWSRNAVLVYELPRGLRLLRSSTRAQQQRLGHGVTALRFALARPRGGHSTLLLTLSTGSGSTVGGTLRLVKGRATLGQVRLGQRIPVTCGAAKRNKPASAAKRSKPARRSVPTTATAAPTTAAMAAPTAVATATATPTAVAPTTLTPAASSGPAATATVPAPTATAMGNPPTATPTAVATGTPVATATASPTATAVPFASSCTGTYDIVATPLPVTGTATLQDNNGTVTGSLDIQGPIPSTGSVSGTVAPDGSVNGTMELAAFNNIPMQVTGHITSADCSTGILYATVLSAADTLTLTRRS